MIRSILASAALALALVSPSFAEHHVSNGTLSVTGEATQTLDNTAADVSFGVQIRANSSEKAVKENSELLANVLAKIEKFGVAKTDMQTSNISLRSFSESRPDNSSHLGQGLQRGFEMNNNLMIHVRDISKLGDILGVATQAGINRIDSVTMVPARDAVDHKAMRLEAAQDARAKANELAAALGLDIVGIHSVNENGAPRPIQARSFDTMRAASMSVPIATGSSQASMTLQVVYKVQLAK